MATPVLEPPRRSRTKTTVLTTTSAVADATTTFNASNPRKAGLARNALVPLVTRCKKGSNCSGAAYLGNGVLTTMAVDSTKPSEVPRKRV